MKNKASRPMSPHLAVYKMQLTSGLSIMHRATGLLLFFGLLLMLWWIIYCIHYYGYSGANPFCISSFRDEIRDSCMFSFFSNGIGKALIILWSYCLFYHLLAGIRHLFWDAGIGLELKRSRASGWLVLFGSVLLWAGNWAYLLI